MTNFHFQDDYLYIFIYTYIYLYILLIYEANDQGVIWMAVGGKNVIDRC